MNKLEIVALQEIKKNINETSSYVYPAKHFCTSFSRQASEIERDISSMISRVASAKEKGFTEQTYEEAMKLLKTLMDRQQEISREVRKVEESLDTGLRKNTKAQSFLDAIIDDNKVG